MVGSALCSVWGLIDPEAVKPRPFLLLFLSAHFVLSIAVAGRIVTNRRAKGIPGKSSAILALGLALGLIFLGLVLIMAIMSMILVLSGRGLSV